MNETGIRYIVKYDGMFIANRDSKRLLTNDILEARLYKTFKYVNASYVGKKDYTVYKVIITLEGVEL